MDAKPWWASKTLWVNAIAILGVFMVGRFLDAETWTQVSVSLLAMVNILLRVFTGIPILGTPGDE